MMKRIILLFSVYVTLGMCSCSTVIVNEVKIGEKENPIRLEEFYDLAEITVLRDTMIIIGGVSSIKKDNRYYYVLDDKEETLSTFDFAGNQKNFLKKIGRSQDEYLCISDFDICGDSIYVLCSPNKIIVTDSLLTPHSIIKLGDDFSHICVCEGLTYLYDGVKRSLCLLEEDGTIVELLNEGTMPACPRLGSQVFFKTTNGVLYIPEGGDVVYRIVGNTVTPLFVFDYPDKQKVMERYMREEIIIGDERFKYSSPVIRSIIEHGEQLVVTYSYAMIVRSFIFDYKSKRVIRDGIWKGLSPFPRFYSEGSVLSTGFATPDKCLVDTSSFSISYTSGKIGEDGNLVIIEYK